ncbi:MULTISPECIES: aldolase/citrate lyase family protein [unclassified Roseibium]|uniref:HpcH/HpaI aldolase family protein n=2 Tax=Roseibium TaxID=150830 RepID=UPI00317C7864
MSDLPRLNGAIRAFENGAIALTAFSVAEITAAQAIDAADYDAVVFEMEHNPFDVTLLRNCLQYMIDRRRVASSGSVAPSVTPMVRLPSNGVERNQWMAKQVLDMGVYGILWPHVCTVEDARAAVAACRYSRPAGSANFDPAGQRGDGPGIAAKYWGLTQQEYYSRADVWPIDPKGEILVGMMCEKVEAWKNLPDILDQVPGIGLVVIGEGDLSQDLGFPRQYDHPKVVEAMTDIRRICAEKGVVCGHPHVNPNNIDGLIDEGYRWLMASPTRSFAALEKGRARLSGQAK